MKKLLLISILLGSIILAGCSLIGEKETNPKILIESLTLEENGIIQEDCLIRRFYSDIDKRITTRNCYSTKVKININSKYDQNEYNQKMIDGIKIIGKYFKNQGFKKNIDNVAESYFLDDWNMFFEGYENNETKCVIIGDNNGSNVSLDISCSNKLEDQKDLQKKLLETINGGVYPYMPYKQYGGVYVDRNMGNFLHVSSIFYGPGGVEMIFKRDGDNFEQIYEGNSGIPCSVVQKYKIPSYVYGECD